MTNPVQSSFKIKMNQEIAPNSLEALNHCDNEPVFFTGLSKSKIISDKPLLCSKCSSKISSIQGTKPSNSDKYCNACAKNSNCSNKVDLQDLLSKIDFNLLEKIIETSSVSPASTVKRKTLLPLPSPSSNSQSSDQSTSTSHFPDAQINSSPRENEKIFNLKRNGSFQSTPMKRLKACHPSSSSTFYHTPDDKIGASPRENEKFVPRRNGSFPNTSAKRLQTYSPSPSSTFCNNSSDKLTQHILQIFMQNKQTDEVYHKKMTLRDKLHEIMLERFPACGLYVVGSSMTKLGVSSSDMDMCLMLTDFEIDQEVEAKNILHKVYSLFLNYSFLMKIEIIYAKVPILKFQDSVSGIEVDLNINNSVGIRNTQLLSSYARIDDRLPPLVVLVKLWARSHGINDAKNNTLSSYSLVLMVIHYLQYRCRPPVLPCLQSLQPDKFHPSSDVRKLKLFEDLPCFSSENQDNLGNLFIGFLKYFSTEFNYDEHVMSVRLGSVIPKQMAIHSNSPKNKKGHWKWVCIEEPFDLTNTACSMFKRDAFFYVKKVFEDSWRSLRSSRNLNYILS
ncbi:poly(A) RNA polymerase GLD2-like [Uloborus diversus]|uniref:poly(A) RNA polymerase GLD2-like n=1 Tax=Uloborus diversus TaxID=327109 RepID=UPI002409C6C2|nr:poly(A) RNA polymerase GLD2-like [Uloborus diversus]XP_054714295.1 poly(A) RNA polymerase GLD2-like [Uloborus diversus]